MSSALLKPKCKGQPWSGDYSIAFISGALLLHVLRGLALSFLSPFSSPYLKISKAIKQHFHCVNPTVLRIYWGLSPLAVMLTLKSSGRRQKNEKSLQLLRRAPVPNRKALQRLSGFWGLTEASYGWSPRKSPLKGSRA